jgi:cation:H+ antiporter
MLGRKAKGRMNMLVYVLLVIGFVLLIKGADFFVDGASSVAKKLSVPSMIIGLTIVAMGTSAPELAVSLSASLKGNNELAISNVIGSNIFNLMVVIGACAVITPVSVKLKTIRSEFPFCIIITILFFFLGADGLFFNRKEQPDGQIGMIGHIDGIILLVIFAGFLYWMVDSAKKARAAGIDEDSTEVDEMKVYSGFGCVLAIVGGAAMIVIGGDIVVDSASEIAARFGMSQSLIGLTIVALGTSLPELVTSIVAARKGDVDMALGNAIGSNIFNILLILGVAAAIHPVAMTFDSMIDLLLLIAMSVIVWVMAFTKRKIGRLEGIGMLAIYAVFLIYICQR